MDGSDAWVVDEPRLLDAVGWVLARATRLRLRIVAAALCFAAVASGMRAALPPSYRATLTFWMQESELEDPLVSPRPPADIQAYITDVAFTRARLLPLLERHDLSPRLRRVNPVAAVDSFRDNVDVRVVQNYFATTRPESGYPRSAQIVLSYTAAERQLAEAVVHDLGQILLEADRSRRSFDLKAALETSNRELQDAQDELQAAQVRLSALFLEQARSGRTRAALLAGEIAAVQRRIDAARGRSLQVERRRADLELAAAAEQQRLWLALRVADESVDTLRRTLDRRGLALYALLAFAATLPIAAVVMAAFDVRIRGPADLRAHGFALLAHVPTFPGIDTGAFRSRASGTRSAGTTP